MNNETGGVAACEDELDGGKVFNTRLSEFGR